MKITQVELYEIEIPPIPPIARYFPKIYDITLCRIQTDEGLEGWGEFQGVKSTGQDQADVHQPFLKEWTGPFNAPRGIYAFAHSPEGCRRRPQQPQDRCCSGNRPRAGYSVDRFANEIRRYRYHLGDAPRQLGPLDLRAKQETPDGDYGQHQGKEGEQRVEGDRASYVWAVLPKEVINGIRAKEHESYEIHSVAP